jgi:L-Ala-D/L-Glu epimerase
MKIKSVNAYQKEFALNRPYTITRKTISCIQMVILEVELMNGIKGMGASSTDFEVVGENASHTFANLQSQIVQQLVGRDIRHFLTLIQEYREIFAAFPGTQAAIDIALHDAFAQWLDIPVVDFYGRKHEKLVTSVTIGIKDVQQTLEEAQEYHERGFRALKVKTGLDPDLDAERIIKLREKFVRHFAIRVDANTGYDLFALKLFLDKIRAQEVELIEQPLLPGMEDELLTLPVESRQMLAADESLKDARSALALTYQKPYGIFNIKLMKCGGIAGALEIANIAKQADISLFWGCNDESIISITAALHAAFACPHTAYIDLDGSFDLNKDVVADGFILEDGYMFPTDKPGLGLTVL